jgi:cyclopropane-fatty-acyl-phospholipid synthase
VAKLELICRKLRLRRGERFLDVGCGWGALVMHAAERYGVEALGITLSEPQAELARERIASRGLRDRCRIEVVDYRDLPTGTRFDKVASVGMVEHVGASQLPIYFREIRRVMSPGGLFLNHGIVSLRPPRSGWRGLMDRFLSSRTSFIQRFVFPDSELLSPSENLAPGEKVGLEARDVENLREHYARTLRDWLHRLEDRRARAVELVGEPTFRVWRLYMAASARLFASAELGVMQTLWGRPREDGSLPIPSSRADIYRPPHPAGTRPTHER